MLNMYRSAESSKTFLVLNLLSFVDTIKPKYCVFENVRGIVQWRLMAVRQDTYTATGGVPMGGLKLVLRCLTSLGFVFDIYLQ
jgi:DNA (cytosine-5)-methyltransferase 1